MSRSRTLWALLCVVVLHAALFVRVDARAPDRGLSVDDRWQTIGEQLHRSGRYARPGRDGRLATTFAAPPAWPVAFWAAYGLFGESAQAHQALNVLCVLMLLGVVVVTWRLGGVLSAGAAILAGGLAASDLSALFWSNSFFIPDVPCALFFSGFILATVRYVAGGATPQTLLLGGLCVGLAGWLKPAVYLAWVPVLPLLAAYARFGPKRRPGAVLRVTIAAALLPAAFVGGWSVRNLLTVGHFSFSSQTGDYMLGWNVLYLRAYQRGIDVGQVPDARTELDAGLVHPEMTEGARNRRYLSAGLREILASPVDYAWVVARNLPVVLLGTSNPTFLLSASEEQAIAALGPKRALGQSTNFDWLLRAWQNGHRAFVCLYVFVKTHLALVYLGSVVGCALLLRQARGRWIVAVMATLVVAVAVVVSPSSHDRYRYPVMPIFYALAGHGISETARIALFRLRARGMIAEASRS